MNNENVKFKKASFLYLISNFINKGIAFLSIPILTRLLSTHDYGLITTYNSWVSILTAFLGMSLNNAIRFSYVKDDDLKHDIKQELSTIFTFTLCVSGIVLSLCIIGISVLNINIDTMVVALCFIHGMFAALITDYTTYLMMEYKYVMRSVLMILPHAIAIVFSVLMIRLMENRLYLGRIVPLCLVNSFIGIYVCRKVYKECKPKIDLIYLKRALKLSAPLIVHAVALNILSQSDRTMLTVFRSASESGIYSLVFNFSMIATVLTTALEGVWIPWFTRNMNEKKYESINSVAKDYVLLMTFIMVCLILGLPEVLKLFVDERYWIGIPLIPPIVLVNFVIFIYTLYVNVEYYYKESLYITKNTICAAVINLILNAIFIPRFGYLAAAFTTLTAYVISFALHANYSLKLNRNLFKPIMFVTPIITILIATIIYYILMNQPLFRWLIIFVYTIIIIVVNFNKLYSYWVRKS